MYRLIAGLAQPSEVPAEFGDKADSNGPVQSLRARARLHHLQNADGSFCWQEQCDGCCSLTKAAQESAIAVARVGDLYKANVGSSQLDDIE